MGTADQPVSPHYATVADALSMALADCGYVDSDLVEQYRAIDTGPILVALAARGYVIEPAGRVAAAAEREKAASDELAKERRFSEQLDADWDRKWQDALEREKAATERIRDAWYAARNAANGDRIVASADDRTAFDRGMDHAERIFLAILADPDAATPSANLAGRLTTANDPSPEPAPPLDVEP